MKLLPNNTNGHLFTIRDNGNKKWPSNLVGISHDCGLKKGNQVYQIELDKDAVVMLRASCCDLENWWQVLIDKMNESKKRLQS